MESVAYSRSLLAPTVPTRSELTKEELTTADKADIVELDTSTEAETLELLPTDWPDGHLLTLKISSVSNALTFDRVIGAATTTKNIRIPDNVGTPSLTELSHKVVFKFNKEDGLWILEYANFNSDIVYDRATDTIGYGGAVISNYKHGFTGDVIIQDDTGEATLTVQNTNASPTAAVLRLVADIPTVVWNDDGGATDQKLMQVGFGSGSMDFAFYNDASSAYAVPLQLTTDGSAGGVKLNGLPTSDPAVAGQLWRDGTDIKISLG
jgi:hypothetical protein